MPNRFASALMASVLFSAPAAALAQAAPSSPAAPASTTVAPVTVEAAPKPQVVQKQAQTFVQSYAATPSAEVGQIARWHEAVCVQVEGLVPAQAAVVRDRIDDVARELGLHAQLARCKANIEIVFTDQPQRMMDIVAKREPILLGYWHRHETERLKTVTRPIQAWYATATRGEALGSGGLMFSQYSQYAQYETEVLDDPEVPPPSSCGDNPHFTNCLVSELKNVFIAADTKALQGKDLGLISDYLALIALSQPRSLDGCNALASVIDVLAKTACPGRDPPDGLTPGDAAYLTALYQSDLEANKAGEQEEIASRMAKILTKAAAGDRK
jgi:hypothetical protein